VSSASCPSRRISSWCSTPTSSDGGLPPANDAAVPRGGVGIVQTPQHFLNPDPIQANMGLTGSWPDEQRYFFDIVMPAKDAWGCAFCCGTSSVIRYDALVKLGGMPTDSVTEDYLLTLRLKEIGYSTAYLNEPLSFGLAPEGLKEYVTQRGRWCLGSCRSCVDRAARSRSADRSASSNA